MVKPLIITIKFVCFFAVIPLMGQKQNANHIFSNYKPLSVSFSLSLKKIKKITNDSTYLKGKFEYVDASGDRHYIDAQYRKRGNFRLKTCSYPPLKVKLDKKQVQGTPFSEHRKFKMVLPCQIDSRSDDLIVKELIAYKMYEKLSPYHFRTRLLEIEFDEQRKNRTKQKILKGFVIEDIDDVADRLGTHVLERTVHPFQQEARISIINAFFQCMIGNTDFSTGHQHNEKLLFKKGKMYPLPYDFDMSGLVDAPYAVISEIQGKQLPIQKVTERLYRGFVRERDEIMEVRALFLDKQPQLLEVIDNHKPYFKSNYEFNKAKTYIIDFFNEIEDADKFENMVLDNLRIKSNLNDSIPH